MSDFEVLRRPFARSGEPQRTQPPSIALTNLEDSTEIRTREGTSIAAEQVARETQSPLTTFRGSYHPSVDARYFSMKQNEACLD